MTNEKCHVLTNIEKAVVFLTLSVHIEGQHSLCMVPHESGGFCVALNLASFVVRWRSFVHYRCILHDVGW